MLKEDTSRFDFSADVEKTLTTLGGAARAAFAKLGGTEKSTTGKKAGEGEKKKQQTATPSTSRTGVSAATKHRSQLADFLVELDDLPTLADMTAFDDMDASEFQEMIIELRKIEEQLVNFGKQYKTLLKSSSFLTAPEKSTDAMDEIIQPVEIDGAVARLNQAIANNLSNVKKALRGIILDPTLETSGKGILSWLNVRNGENERYNQAKPMSPVRPTGAALARLFNAYVQQVMIPRVERLLELVPEYEKKSVTKETLSNLKTLVTLLQEKHQSKT